MTEPPASPQPGAARRSPAGAVLLAAAATVMSVLPVHLAGAMAVQITGDLRFGLGALGLSFGAFRLTSAAVAVPLGRLSDRLGATRALRLATLVSLVCSVGVATGAHGWGSFIAWMMVGSCSNTLAQPAANRLVLRSVDARRQGLAFGLKQTGPPAASMLAGLAVPLVALTVGWRWAYLLVAALAVGVALAAGRRRPPASRPEPATGASAPSADRGIILVLALAFALGTIASSVGPAFYVDAAVRAGTAPQHAGVVLAAASLVAIASRITSGFVCDRLRSGHLKLCAGLLAAGSAGLACMAVGRPLPLAAGLFVALAGTWGFNGVMWFSLVRAYPAAPGAITGAVAPGGYIGGSVGPMVFGFLAEGAGYGLAWGFAAAMSLAAAGAMHRGATRLRLRGRG